MQESDGTAEATARQGHGESLDPALLDRCARAFAAILDAGISAQQLVEISDAERARRDLTRMNEIARAFLNLLRARGARLPDAGWSGLVAPEYHDTHVAQRLLEALNYVRDFAQLLDEERGRVLPSGEGYEWADAVGALHERLQAEIAGAAHNSGAEAE